MNVYLLEPEACVVCLYSSFPSSGCMTTDVNPHIDDERMRPGRVYLKTVTLGRILRPRTNISVLHHAAVHLFQLTALKTVHMM